MAIKALERHGYEGWDRADNNRSKGRGDRNSLNAGVLVRLSRFFASQWPKPRRLGLIVAVAAIASGCGVFAGDESEAVYLHNTLDVPVSVYQTDGKQAGPSQLVQPGQTATNRWLVAGKRDGTRAESGLPPRQVEAKTESGERVFCHRYTDTELDGLRWTIDIRRTNDCG
jgi:hypothetical protein